ncbi:hypothetical protein COU54_02590 [Candidatus Pacearchaeota archaeon CG10_big_fil_rev_8_21_14_0_10_31_24]|nr:MAG: hypothetical protein COU54_02590 [Candidatus Pacearchaeota archaeon CG10_big_fil_rev_8_21_14_0_10_31_24]
MKLDKKKSLAIKTLGVGKQRIIFNTERLSEIKEAITRQDIRDLVASKAITILPIKGRRTIQRRTTRRRAGSIKKVVNSRKRDYMTRTRKLRGYIAELRKQEKIDYESYLKLYKEIGAGRYRSKAHLKEHIK